MVRYTGWAVAILVAAGLTGVVVADAVTPVRNTSDELKTARSIGGLAGGVAGVLGFLFLCIAVLVEGNRAETPQAKPSKANQLRQAFEDTVKNNPTNAKACLRSLSMMLVNPEYADLADNEMFTMRCKLACIIAALLYQNADSRALTDLATFIEKMDATTTFDGLVSETISDFAKRVLFLHGGK